MKNRIAFLASFTMSLLILSSTGYAGGDSHRPPFDGVTGGSCHGIDGSERACSGRSGPVRKPRAFVACKNTLPYVPEMTCKRTGVLAPAFSGVNVPSSIELIKANWVQDPTGKSRGLICLVAGKSGYEVHYSISEVDQLLDSSSGVALSQTDIDGLPFAGLTTENRIAFKSYNFSGLAPFVKNNSALEAAAYSRNEDNGFANGSKISYDANSNQAVINGYVLRKDLNVEGVLNNLTFKCN